VESGTFATEKKMAKCCLIAFERLFEERLLDPGAREESWMHKCESLSEIFDIFKVRLTIFRPNEAFALCSEKLRSSPAYTATGGLYDGSEDIGYHLFSA
jgi:hypothetical protein